MFDLDDFDYALMLRARAHADIGVDAARDRLEIGHASCVDLCREAPASDVIAVWRCPDLIWDLC